MAYSLLREMEVRGRDTSQWPLSLSSPVLQFSGLIITDLQAYGKPQAQRLMSSRDGLPVSSVI